MPLQAMQQDCFSQRGWTEYSGVSEVPHWRQCVEAKEEEAMSLRDALEQITQSDLDDVNKQIETAEAELAKLTELRRIIEIKLGFAKPRGKGNWGGALRKKAAPADPPPATVVSDDEPEAPLPAAVEAGVRRTATGVTDVYRCKAREFLMANGTTKLTRLAAMCDIPPGSITAVVKHRWFTSGTAGIGLSAAAYNEK